MAKVVLKTPRPLETAEAKQLVDTYERFHRGPGNWFRPAVMAGEGEVINISIPPEDAQFLQTREFQALDVARWYRVPPHRVGILTKQTSFGSGLAEENQSLVQSTYRPWILRFEEAFTKYAPGGEARGLRIRLNDAALTRGSQKEQADSVVPLVSGQILTPNEARKILGYPPIEGGDEVVKPPEPAAPGAGADPKKKDPKQTDAAAKEKDRERKSFRLGGTPSERRDFSEVERTVNHSGDSCPKCAANDNPARVPVHPHCNCVVETDRVAVGRSVDEIESLTRGDYDLIGDDLPDALRPDPATASKLDPADFRFADLTTWVEQLKSTRDTGYITAVVNEPSDELARALWLIAQEAADAISPMSFKRSMSERARVYVLPIDASIDDLVVLYDTITEGR
jgi:hypothetical protein